METIYDELLHIRALAHLSNSVKRELSSVIVFESHPRAGTVCKSHYIVRKFFIGDNRLPLGSAARGEIWRRCRQKKKTETPLAYVLTKGISFSFSTPPPYLTAASPLKGRECQYQKLFFRTISVFHQGDEGRSWYIIIRGSVDVVIHGKGTVNTLHEGDDFGKLALINDAPRYKSFILS